MGGNGIVHHKLVQQWRRDGKQLQHHGQGKDVQQGSLQVQRLAGKRRQGHAGEVTRDFSLRQAARSPKGSRMVKLPHRLSRLKDF